MFCLNSYFANLTKCSWGGIGRKELRNGLQLADDDIIREGLDIVTDKTKNKPKAEQETAQARFNYEHNSWILQHNVQLLINHFYNKFWN